MTLLRRIGAGLAACWVMRESTFPKGTYVVLFLAASSCTGRSVWVEHRLNIADGAILLALSFLMVSAFVDGFRARGTAETDSPPN